VTLFLGKAEGIHGRCFVRIELDHDLAADYRKHEAQMDRTARKEPQDPEG